MRESGFYPPGAEFDPNAPYNEVSIPEKAFDVCVSQTLSKSTGIYTNNYLLEFDDESGRTYANTEETDWKKAYQNVAMTPLDIINAAEKIAKTLLEQGQTRVGGVYLKSLVSDCKGWTEDELEVMEN